MRKANLGVSVHCALTLAFGKQIVERMQTLYYQCVIHVGSCSFMSYYAHVTVFKITQYMLDDNTSLATEITEIGLTMQTFNA